MRLTKSLLTVISALALATGAAFATEEQFSLIEPGTGPELMGSYEVTSEGDVISSERFSEPMNEPDLLASSEEFSEPMSESDRVALAEPDLVIYEETTIVFAPSDDTEDAEMSLG